MFSPNQLIVYPTQGVGRVDCINKQTINDTEILLYSITILHNNVKAMVPVANAKSIGLRELCSKEIASEVLSSFQNKEGISSYVGQNWNRRHREYTEKLKGASLFDVALVIKELLLIRGEKDLSFGEKRLLELAMNLISSELSVVLDLSSDEIQTQIESFFPEIVEKNKTQE